MNVLVLNSGSSSLKFQVISAKTEKVLMKGIADGIGLPTCKFKVDEGRGEQIFSMKFKDHKEAVSQVMKEIDKDIGLSNINAIGHRVVHGGEHYHDATVINNDVIKTIDRLSELAPLHNPPNLAGILACKKMLPKLKQVAVFDTAFHQTMPAHSYMYAIPYEHYQKYKIRKYGFHGTSHKYVTLEAQKYLKKKANLVTCHLGNGSSITSVLKGKSVDTTMGLTPLQGVIMGTRSGSIDPEIVPFLADKLKVDAHAVIKMLNKESGLKGICGYPDVRTIYEKAKKGNKKCRLALDMLGYNLSMFISAHMAVLPSVDAIVFTAGIGQGAWYLREAICDNLAKFGVNLDRAKNRKNKAMDVTARGSKVKVLVIPTNEELMIAKETARLVKS
ncbi:MAG: acetate kinase [Nanoarchaeota archaeon]|nr:acetate kinase [Nanoarchaeota archaeon]